MATPQEKSDLETLLPSDALTKRASNKRKSGWISRICTVLGAALALGACYAVFKLAQGALTTLGRPFPQLLANKTLADIGADGGSEPWLVVRPLVDEDTKFDIVATVRAREWMARRRPAHPVGIAGERVVFSGTIFKGLTMKDKHIHTQVNLSVPLGAFTEEALDNYDLRATFILVPQSPSLLDHMVGTTTWHPNMDIHKLNTQPENAQCHADRTVTQRQLASVFFGITIPLIEFNPIKSACGKDAEGPSWDVEDVTSLHQQSVVSAKGRPPLQAHPYLITRTDLRVVHMTELYDARGWLMIHKTLGMNATNPMACPPRLFTKPTIEDLWNCKREFSPRGNTEVGIKVSLPDEKTGENVTVLAYAPYLEAPYRSWGPLDLVPLPVNRENCPVEPTASRFSAEHYQSKDIVWNVAFSVTSPARLGIAHALAGILKYNLTDTEYKKAIDQVLSERLAAVGGHRFSLTSHTYRKWFLGDVSFYLFQFSRAQYVVYWMLLGSTEGISTIGSALLSVSYILPIISGLLVSPPGHPKLSLSGLSYDVKARALIALGIWKSLLRVSASRSFPFVWRRQASNGELSSRKLEERAVGMGAIALVTLAATLFAFLGEVKPEAITILPGIGPARDTPPSDAAMSPALAALKNTLIEALFISGEITQLFLNYRLKTFAGRTKLTAFVVLMGYLMGNAEYLNVYWITGDVGLRDPLSALRVVPLVLGVVWVVQALRCRYVWQGGVASAE